MINEKRSKLALLGQFESLKKQAEDVLKKYDKYDKMMVDSCDKNWDQVDVMLHLQPMVEQIDAEATGLFEAYSIACPIVKKVLGIELKKKFNSYKPRSILRLIIIEGEKVIGILSDLKYPLTSEEGDKLFHIKNELSKVCENIDINFEKNLNHSLKEAENGHFLASVLITSRVIDFIYHVIPGNELEEKIDFLSKNKIITTDDKELKQQIIKAIRLTRDFLNHRIDTFAEPSDALSLLGDCIKILKIYEKMKKTI